MLTRINHDSDGPIALAVEKEQMIDELNSLKPGFDQVGYKMDWLFTDPFEWPTPAFADPIRNKLLRSDGEVWHAVVIAWYDIGDGEDGELQFAVAVDLCAQLQPSARLVIEVRYAVNIQGVLEALEDKRRLLEL